ncbi:MAG: ribosome biogenesis GTPase YlqF [Tissierellia bacterium]|nr:ribosome biogenesis GTPase YlqF [Tissierellia bacterium]
MNINWYPGHMKKTTESIKENLKMVDVIFELIDARIPSASSNPVIPELIGEKPRIVVLNKADLANEEENKKWIEHFKNEGANVVSINANTGKGIRELITLTNKVMKPKRDRDAERGIKSKMTRVMIIGIPNVGKSTLINSLVGRKSAKIGNRPGITKSNQWVRVQDSFQLLDTPGVLWPKFQNENLALNLAYTGAIKDEILDKETLCLKFIEKMMLESPEVLVDRYNIEIGSTPLETMEAIALKRGAILRGNEIDYTKVSDIVLDEFRRGTLGRITLDKIEN